MARIGQGLGWRAILPSYRSSTLAREYPAAIPRASIRLDFDLWLFQQRLRSEPGLQVVSEIFYSTFTAKFPSHPSAIHPTYARYGLRFVPHAQMNTPPAFSSSSANVLPDDRIILLGPHITELHFHAPHLPPRRHLPFRTPCLPGPRFVSSTSIVELSPAGLNWEKLSVTRLWSEKTRIRQHGFPLFP